MARPLFSCVGIELEYMLVDRHSLDVRAVADRVLHAAAGERTGEVERPPLSWSNELALHVIELKTNEPVAALSNLEDSFQRGVLEINELAAESLARLMPTAMHPWMDPDRELQLWPHDYNPVYEAFDRIFDCRGHGWANLQSCHINLPFHGDEEFVRLHTAIRLLLPLLPALAASSPLVDGRLSGWCDTRMEVYRHNARRVPQVTGSVVPESVGSIDEYHERILTPLYQAIAPHDSEEILQEEWLNARGAIARFERQSIEIRVLDVQECPMADLAIASTVIAVLKLLCQEQWSLSAKQRKLETPALAALLQRCSRHANKAMIDDTDYLRLFDIRRPRATAGTVWQHLVDAARKASDSDLMHYSRPIDAILRHGPLSRRIADATGKHPDRGRLQEVYGQIADCLHSGTMYIPDIDS